MDSWSGISAGNSIPEGIRSSQVALASVTSLKLRVKSGCRMNEVSGPWMRVTAPDLPRGVDNIRLRRQRCLVNREMQTR